jgi:hypothetical protein
MMRVLEQAYEYLNAQPMIPTGILAENDRAWPWTGCNLLWKIAPDHPTQLLPVPDDNLYEMVSIPGEKHE